ncbi:uncharacterized protein [Oscarella lobularis]|uniref:uncharacterized protein isoform X2 n=1 Tax=Oscarella lobularis TaxID=121494 RepID=UPI00331382BC
MESLIVSVVFFYLSCVRGDGQQTSSCSQYTYGCSYQISYTSYYSQRHTHSRESCGWAGWNCNNVYWSTYEQKSRQSYRMQCRACNVDCQVNSWGNWGACDGTCHDTTIQWRYRSVWRNKYGNGNSCPSTSESQRCYIDSKACKIGGVCYAHLQRQSSTGNGSCQECNKLVSRDAWTPVLGGSCDDTLPCNCTSVSLFCAVLVDVQSVGSNAMLVKPVNEANATCLNRNLWENESSLVNFGENSWNDTFCEVSSKSFAVQQGFTEMDLSELPCLLHRFVVKSLFRVVLPIDCSSSPTSPLEVNFVEHLYKKPNGRLGVRTTDLSTVNETIDSLRSAPCDCEQEVLFRWLQGHIEANMSRCTWKGNQLLLSLTINGDKCGLLRAPTHGHVSCSSPASGQQETCTVQCDHGFGLRSSSMQICDPVVGWSFNATGKPTGNHLRCIPII